MTAYKYGNDILDSSVKFKEVVRGKDVDPLLYDLLIHATPHPYEYPVREVIKEFVRKTEHTELSTDVIGNLIVRVGKNNETMFSCHMDTVHTRAGKISLLMSCDEGEGGGYIYAATKDQKVYFRRSDTDTALLPQQLPTLAKEQGATDSQYTLVRCGTSDCGHPQYNMKIWLDKQQSVPFVPPITLTKITETAKYSPSILGADDKLGCYILCRLIEHGINGLYIFHVGEEKGLIGSRHIVTKTPDVVKGIKRAIAFDRMNYGDVVHTQYGSRCASAEFVDELAVRLNRLSPPKAIWTPCSGVYTDTAEYTGLIPECTNLSVGYFRQHSSNERFDLVWLEANLVPMLRQLDWGTLPTVRKPEPKYARYSYHGGVLDDDWNVDNYRYSHANVPFVPSVTKNGSSYTNTSGKQKTSVIALPSREEQNIAAVPMDGVTENTPYNVMPNWIPEDGIINKLSKKAMLRLIACNMLRGNKTYLDMAEIIYDLLEEVRDLEADLDIVTSKVDYIETML